MATLLGNCFCFHFNEWSVGLSYIIRGVYHRSHCFLTDHSFQITTMKHYIRLISNGKYHVFYCCEAEESESGVLITNYNNKGDVDSIDSFNWDTVTMYRKFPHNPHYGKEKADQGQVCVDTRGDQNDGPVPLPSPEMGRGSERHGPVRKAWQALVSFLDIDKGRQKV